MQLVLASSSPYRRALLERLQLPFRTASPDVDESPLPGESPRALASRLARTKAQSLQETFPRSLIIGSDQVATIDDRTPIGKPGIVDRAREQLRASSGRTVVFYTGLSVLNTASGDHEHLVDRYEIQFRTLTDQEIDHYLKREEPLDCAGSFKAEGLGSALFERHHGADPTALIGLPLIALCRCLAAQGMPVL